jgi:hypothetical protein
VGEFGDKQGDTSPCTDSQKLSYRSLFYKLPACQGDVETDLRISPQVTKHLHPKSCVPPERSYSRLDVKVG